MYFHEASSSTILAAPRASVLFYLLAWMTRHGPWPSIEGLMEVPGCMATFSELNFIFTGLTREATSALVLGSAQVLIQGSRCLLPQGGVPAGAGDTQRTRTSQRQHPDALRLPEHPATEGPHQKCYQRHHQASPLFAS